MIRATVLVFMLTTTTVSAEQFKLPWKGDYPHNSSKAWSRDNPNDSGFSKNFLNGTLEEGGKVERMGELWAETMLPEKATGPIPFVIVMHGCTGMTSLTSAWVHRMGRVFNADGIGVLILDSFTTRKVDKSCGMPDLHWGRRRADDAYSALDYLIEKKLAKADEVYVMGQSGGGTATLIAMTKAQTDHKYRFAAGFPVVPPCVYPSVRNADFYGALVLFVGEKDDANDPKQCVELAKRKRNVPVQVIVYANADHGFMEDYKERVAKGWTDAHGKDHYWHLSYNPLADKDMMRSIISRIKTRKFVGGVEFRPTDAAEHRK
ncbi:MULTISPECIES: dienelactone hydrolase family protein [unclassified Bradyrhizobium]|uniref:dienelactone hydrolase family protein n=1 Tax=Bradyrhizobium sp. USDA 4541 TaxID=2817704 RepID=UPI0020A43DB7|nr:prolyl oligopeptidase family serine peptidase [Bradyrhizobium sp. USDA 4541]MCP1848371.1 dienelactone hydrolase [Bradyrhizobium sp. USDA 4541]